MKCLLKTERVCLVSLITCSPQFKEKSFQFSGTTNMQVTTDLISTSWNTERNSILSALIAKHRKKQKKRCGKGTSSILALIIFPFILVEQRRKVFKWLTNAPRSINRGVIPLRTLAEIAADSIGAFAHSTKTGDVWALVQIWEGKGFVTKPHLKKNIKNVDKAALFVKHLIYTHRQFNKPLTVQEMWIILFDNNKN